MSLPLGIVLAVVVAIAAVSGFTLYATGALTGLSFAQKDPAKILEESINRSNSVSKYDIQYDILNSVKSDTEDLDITGSLRITQSGENKRVVYTLELLGSPTTIEIYQAPGKAITCASPFGERQCQESPGTPPVQSPVEQHEQLRKHLDEGVVSLSYTGQSNIAGKRCDVVRAVYDIRKLVESSEFDGTQADAIKSMVLDVCIEEESGLPLSTDLMIDIESEEAIGTVKTSLTAKSFSLDAPEIEIPEVSAPLQLPDLSADIFS